MAPLKNLPKPISHLNARLRSLKRPMVWGPALILGLIVLFTIEYWLSPNWSKVQNNNADEVAEAEDSLSPEDRAIGADIDSLPLLLKQFENNVQLPVPVDEKAAKAKPGKSDILTRSLRATSENALDGVLTAGNTVQSSRQTSPTSLLPDPQSANSSPLAPGLTTPSYMGLQTLNTSATGATSTVPSSGAAGLSPDVSLFGTAGSTTNTPLPLSPLQNALNQSQVGVASPTNTINSTDVTSSMSTPEGTLPGSTQPLPATGATASGVEGAGVNYSNSPVMPASEPPNAFNYLTGSPASTGTTNFSSTPTVPNLPSAPVVAPVPSNIGGSTLGQPSGFSSSPSSTGVGSSSFSSTTNNPATSTVPNNTRPFSVPRRTPGRYIGGGEINTFSNP